MESFSKILVGSDLSEESDKALQTGIGLCLENGQTLHVVHAIPENLRETSGSGISVTRKDIQAEIDKRVRSVAAALGGTAADDLKVEIFTRFGRPHEVVCDVSEEVEADLIILGRHGSHVIEHLFLGSTTAKVTRQTKAAVLVTSANTSAATDYKQIVAAVDFSDISHQIVEVAASVARRSGGLLHILHVYESLGLYEYTSITPNIPASRYDEKMAKEAQNSLEAIVEEHDLKGLNPSCFVRPGMPAGEILFQSEKIGADLIVLGSNRRTGVDRVLLGNTADRVIRRAKNDVLVVKQ